MKSGFDPHLQERIESHLQRNYLETGRLVGCHTVVARREGVVASIVQGMADRERQQPLQEDAIFRIYSMSKPITSVALMQQYERGRFLLEEPVSKYLPEFADVAVWQAGSWPNYLTKPPKRPPTIRDLLTHTSGLTYDFMRRTNVDYGYRKQKLGRASANLDEFSKELATMPLEFSPGEHWNYSFATDLCGRLVEVLSGQSFDAYLEEHIFAPLGMKDTGFHLSAEQAHRLSACYEYRPNVEPALQDPAGAESHFAKPPGMLSGGGGLLSSMTDYHRFCAMLLNGGELEGARVLGPKTLVLMTRNHLPDGADMGAVGVPGAFSEAPYHGVGFGLGFAVLLDPAKAQITGCPGEYFWGGMASTAFWISPQDNLLVIFMTQLIPSAQWPVRRELRAIVHGCLLD